LPLSTDIAGLMERARLLRLKQDHVARYSKVNVAILSRATNYGQYVELADFRKIEAFIETAEALTRRAGAALDWKDFVAIDRLLKEHAEEKINPPPAPTPRDWELLGLVTDRSKTPVSIAKDLGISLSDLSSQMADAMKRFDHCANQLAARSADIAALSKETIAFVDEQQAKRTLQQ
jgi:hypothetical protein